MPARPQIALIMFALGVGLVALGVFRVGVAATTNTIALVLGLLLAAAGLGWWWLLRRNRQA
ncbi:MAG: LPXTG cell wall anchor domain-containing protein [SAR202 cluster bacterium]|nr:LPXTG cell wall anchor domain-containing protein [SAR202 cluster bacterium]